MYNINPSIDYKTKEIIINKQKIILLYNDILVNKEMINKEILSKIKDLSKKQIQSLNKYLPNINTEKIKKKDINNKLNNSNLILIINNNIYSIEVKLITDRAISPSTNELNITGPKDSFNENINTNINLIRKRIKSKNLILKESILGKQTNTKVSILYMNNIANKKLINQIQNRINKINIDGIIDSSYIKKYLDTNKLFPTIIQTERHDKASIALLEGKCIILVENSPYALILPSFFLDFFHTPDEYYQKNINTTFIRLIRLSAFLISLLTPAIYIATTTRNYNLLPYKLLIMLKAGRTFVPFPAYIEAIFMIICFEILKETDIRMSQTSSSAVSILGGLILGDAAVSAGIVSPIMIIVIAISSISGLIFSSLELSNALRSYKIILLILSSLLGIYGVLIGLIYLIINLINTKTFNYKYLSPIYPFNKNEIKDSFIKLKNNKRNSYITNNINRGD